MSKHCHNKEASIATPIGQVRYIGTSIRVNRIGGWYRRVDEKWIGGKKFIWRLVAEYEAPLPDEELDDPQVEPRHARESDEAKIGPVGMVLYCNLHQCIERKTKRGWRAILPRKETLVFHDV